MQNVAQTCGMKLADATKVTTRDSVLQKYEIKHDLSRSCMESLELKNSWKVDLHREYCVGASNLKAWKSSAWRTGRPQVESNYMVHLVLDELKGVKVDLDATGMTEEAIIQSVSMISMINT